MNDLISRQDAVNEIHKYFVAEIDKTPTEIDEDGDELYADMPTVNSLLACNKELSKRIKSLPSAQPIGDLVSRQAVLSLFSNSFYSGLAEQINALPSAPDSRRRGEWVDNHNGTFVCDQCGCKHSKSNFCPNCGTRMYKGGEEE